jgi:hypothetical protein
MQEQLKLENEARTIRRDAADARCQAAGLCFEERARLERFAEGMDIWAAELEEKVASRLISPGDQRGLRKSTPRLERCSARRRTVATTGTS